MKTSSEIFTGTQEIMVTFDFEAVLAYMAMTRHKWQQDDGSVRVPTLDELKSTAKRLLMILYDKKVAGVNNYSAGTGGFWAYMFDYGIKLSFEFKSQSSF